jgi:hypothetical protein
MKPFNPQNFQNNDQENQQNFYNPQQQLQQGGNLNFYNPQQQQQQQQGSNETNQNFYNPQQQGNNGGGNLNFYNPQQQQQQGGGMNFQNSQQQGNQTNFYNPQQQFQGGNNGSQNFYNPQQQQLQGSSNQTNFQTSQQTPNDQFFIPKNNQINLKGPPPMMSSTTDSFFDPNEKKIAPPPTNVTWDPQNQNQGNLTEITHKLENLEVSENFTEVDLNKQENLPRPTFNKYNSFVPQPDVSPLFNRFNVKGEETIDYSNTQASSCFCRATVQTVPNTPQLLTQWSLPFGVILKPFSDEETPIVHNFKSTGPIRCFNCKAYINPFVLFIEDGRKWQCNMCKSINQGKNERKFITQFTMSIMLHWIMVEKEWILEIILNS